MTGNFGILINPELILKLTEPEWYQRQRKRNLDLFQEPISKPVPPETSTAQETAPSKPSAPSLAPGEPLAPPKSWHGPVSFSDPRDNDVLEPFRKVVAVCEHAVENLGKHEEKEREEVHRRAEELYRQQYHVPQPKPFPCPDEYKSCLDCLTGNQGDILKCRDSIKAYSICAEQVRQRFVAAGFRSHQVNT